MDRTDSQLIDGMDKHWRSFAFIAEGEFPDGGLRGAINDALDEAERLTPAEIEENRQEALADLYRDEGR